VSDEREELVKNIRVKLRLLHVEANKVRNYFEDKNKFVGYLYYLHNLFSKLELMMVQLDRIDKERKKDV
jgi:hypothetical protein